MEKYKLYKKGSINKSELARIDSLINMENMRLYGSNDEPLKRVF